MSVAVAEHDPEKSSLTTEEKAAVGKGGIIAGQVDVHLVDEEFGGTEARRRLERRLLLKLDLRMSIVRFHPYPRCARVYRSRAHR